jgi:hypothetical protein
LRRLLGRLDRQVLAHIAMPESFPGYMGPVFQVFLRLPNAHGYFDNMLRQNGVYEQRFARPFIS